MKGDPGHSWQCHPRTGGPGYFKKVGQASHRKQVSKLQSRMASASVPALWIFYPDILWAVKQNVSRKKPFSPQVAFDLDILSKQ